jgi:hypothetical protein
MVQTKLVLIRCPSIRDTALDIMVVSSRIGHSSVSNNRVKINGILQRPIWKRSASAVQYAIEREATAAFPRKGGRA